MPAMINKVNNTIFRHLAKLINKQNYDVRNANTGVDIDEKKVYKLYQSKTIG